MSQWCLKIIVWDKLLNMNNKASGWIETSGSQHWSSSPHRRLYHHSSDVLNPSAVHVGGPILPSEPYCYRSSWTKGHRINQWLLYHPKENLRKVIRGTQLAGASLKPKGVGKFVLWKAQAVRMCKRNIASANSVYKQILRSCWLCKTSFAQHVDITNEHLNQNHLKTSSRTNISSGNVWNIYSGETAGSPSPPQFCNKTSGRSLYNYFLLKDFNRTATPDTSKSQMRKSHRWSPWIIFSIDTQENRTSGFVITWVVFKVKIHPTFCCKSSQKICTKKVFHVAV